MPKNRENGYECSILEFERRYGDARRGNIIGDWKLEIGDWKLEIYEKG